jgi:hypothetical protein
LASVWKLAAANFFSSESQIILLGAAPRRMLCFGRQLHRLLIGRYGWEAYRRFYRRSDALNLNSYFRKVFGVGLEKAEWQWRTELDVMAALASRVRRNALFE